MTSTGNGSTGSQPGKFATVHLARSRPSAGQAALSFSTTSTRSSAGSSPTPSEHAHVAHALWNAHTHLMDAWDSTPRIAFLSPEPGSGKSRAIEVAELLVPNPVEAVNVTAAYPFRKVGETAPTILYDEIDTVFGPKAKENKKIRGLLNAGHRRGAVAGRCVVKGKTVQTEEIPAYCAVAFAGLGGLPDTLQSRSVVIRMRKRAPSEPVEPFRRREHPAEGHALRDRLERSAEAWCA
jgi:hypothetical protein